MRCGCGRDDDGDDDGEGRRCGDEGRVLMVWCEDDVSDCSDDGDVFPLTWWRRREGWRLW